MKKSNKQYIIHCEDSYTALLEGITRRALEDLLLPYADSLKGYNVINHISKKDKDLETAVQWLCESVPILTPNTDDKAIFDLVRYKLAQRKVKFKNEKRYY